MKHPLNALMSWFLLVGLTPAFGQETLNLDDLGAVAAPAPARSRAPVPAAPSAAGTKVNLYADLDFLATWSSVEPSAATATAGFAQNHTAILLKALYNGDQASMVTDALHPESYFELGINASLWGPGFARIPILGTSSWRFGRILVPFGDFEFHHLYGGYVDETGVLFPKLWSDLGVSWKFSVADGLESETMVGNGFGSAGVNPSFQSPGLDNNLAKAVAERLRWTPSPASFVLLSGYFDQWGTAQPEAWLAMVGLDVGNKFGPLGLKAGGFFNVVAGAQPKGYFRYAGYAEAKFTLDPAWALRARAGAMNPDTRARDATDQWDANVALLWYGGPLAVEVLYSYNQEFYQPGVAGEPNNFHQVLVKCLLNL